MRAPIKWEETMNETTQTKGWFDIAREKFNSSWFAQQFDFSACSVLQMLSYAGIGFASGFVLKRYATLLLTAFIAVAIVLWFLSAWSIVTIDWTVLKTSIGLDATATFDSIIRDVIVWIPQHKVLSVCVLLGFFIGYKIG